MIGGCLDDRYRELNATTSIVKKRIMHWWYYTRIRLDVKDENLQVKASLLFNFNGMILHSQSLFPPRHSISSTWIQIFDDGGKSSKRNLKIQKIPSALWAYTFATHWGCAFRTDPLRWFVLVAGLRWGSRVAALLERRCIHGEGPSEREWGFLGDGDKGEPGTHRSFDYLF